MITETSRGQQSTKFSFGLSGGLGQFQMNQEMGGSQVGRAKIGGASCGRGLMMKGFQLKLRRKWKLVEILEDVAGCLRED